MSELYTLIVHFKFKSTEGVNKYTLIGSSTFHGAVKLRKWNEHVNDLYLNMASREIELNAEIYNNKVTYLPSILLENFP